MEEFFQSVARSFAENRDALPTVQVAILVMVAAVLLLQVGGMVRRRLARRTRFQELAARRGLDGEDVRFVTALARRSGLDPFALLTHVDLFERTTGRALAEAMPHDGGEEPAARIRHLRQALGFDRLPTYAPLLSSRELMPGTAVEVGTQRGQIVHVDEASLSVELPAAPAAPPGQAVALGLAHAREARYTLRCPLLSVADDAAGGCVVRLGHDEAPQRVQQREYVRVQASGPVSLRPVGGWQARAVAGGEVRGELRDLSGGGALVTTRTQLPVGLLLRASFGLERHLFADLRAVVVASERAPDGTGLAHLEFTRIGEPERERLIAALTQLELAEASGQASAR